MFHILAALDRKGSLTTSKCFRFCVIFVLRVRVLTSGLDDCSHRLSILASEVFFFLFFWQLQKHLACLIFKSVSLKSLRLTQPSGRTTETVIRAANPQRLAGLRTTVSCIKDSEAV